MNKNQPWPTAVHVLYYMVALSCAALRGEKCSPNHNRVTPKVNRVLDFEDGIRRAIINGKSKEPARRSKLPSPVRDSSSGILVGNETSSVTGPLPNDDYVTTRGFGHSFWVPCRYTAPSVTGPLPSLDHSFWVPCAQCKRNYAI